MPSPGTANRDSHDLTSRDRVLKALNHEEPDRVPYDLSSTHVTGIAQAAYQKLRRHLGYEEREPVWADVIQQLAQPDEDLLDYLRVDTRGLFPLTSHNWNVYEQLQDAGDVWEYQDEWGITFHFPKQHGHWFSSVAFWYQRLPTAPFPELPDRDGLEVI